MRFNCAYDDTSHRRTEVNDGVDSEFFVADERTSVQDFIREFYFTGVVPEAQSFRDVRKEVPEDLCTIYPDVTQSLNIGSKYTPNDDEKKSDEEPTN